MEHEERVADGFDEQLPSYKVIIVDDEQHILNSLKRLLRKEKYKISIENSPLRTLERFQEGEEYHLIISDQRMPEMTGTSLLGKIQECSPQTVRVILSGYADAQSIIGSINKGGIHRFFSKPWNDEELKRGIIGCLESYWEREEADRLYRDLELKNKKLVFLSHKRKELLDERTQKFQIYQEVLEELPLPVMGVSEEGIIVFINESFYIHCPDIASSGFGALIQETLPDEWGDLFKKVSFEKIKLEKKVQVGDNLLTAIVRPLLDGDELYGVLFIITG